MKRARLLLAALACLLVAGGALGFTERTDLYEEGKVRVGALVMSSKEAPLDAKTDQHEVQLTVKNKSGEDCTIVTAKTDNDDIPDFAQALPRGKVVRTSEVLDDDIVMSYDHGEVSDNVLTFDCGAGPFSGTIRVGGPTHKAYDVLYEVTSDVDEAASEAGSNPVEPQRIVVPTYRNQKKRWGTLTTESHTAPHQLEDGTKAEEREIMFVVVNKSSRDCVIVSGTSDDETIPTFTNKPVLSNQKVHSAEILDDLKLEYEHNDMSTTVLQLRCGDAAFVGKAVVGGSENTAYELKFVIEDADSSEENAGVAEEHRVLGEKAKEEEAANNAQAERSGDEEVVVQEPVPVPQPIAAEKERNPLKYPLKFPREMAEIGVRPPTEDENPVVISPGDEEGTEVNQQVLTKGVDFSSEMEKLVFYAGKLDDLQDMNSRGVMPELSPEENSHEREMAL